MVLLTIAYSVLAFAAVIVLIASTLALLAFVVKQTVSGIDALVERTISAGSPSKAPRTKRRRLFNVPAPSRIPGAHNETL